MNLNCPSCEGLCLCKICAKNKERQDLENENLILLGKKTNDSIVSLNINKKNKRDNLISKIEKMRNQIRNIFPNIDNEIKSNKDKNNKIIPLIEPSVFQLIRQYNLNINEIINNKNEL